MKVEKVFVLCRICPQIYISKIVFRSCGNEKKAVAFLLILLLISCISNVNGDEIKTVVLQSPKNALRDATHNQELIVGSVLGHLSTAAEKKNLLTKEAKFQNEQLGKFRGTLDEIVTKNSEGYLKKRKSAIIGVYIKEMSTGYTYELNASKLTKSGSDEGFFMSASTCKLMAACAVYLLDYRKELAADKTYTDKVTGEKFNLRNLTHRMISHSVNDSFNKILRLLGAKKLNSLVHELGAVNSFVYSEISPAPNTSPALNMKRYGVSRSPRTTPKDLGLLVEVMYRGDVLGDKNSKHLTDSMLKNIYNNRLPQGISFKSPVGHKTGTSTAEGVYNDAGVVYLEGNPFIIVVMSKNADAEVQGVYRSIAREVYSFMKKRI